MGALRSGAGLVTVATPASCLPVVAGLGAEYMTLALAELADGTLARSAAGQLLDREYDVMALGPGLGIGSDQEAFVRAVVDRAARPARARRRRPHVLSPDASALRGSPERPVVITPHPARWQGLPPWRSPTCSATA